MRQISIILVAALVLISACSTKASTGGNHVEFHGTVTRVEVDGGIWMIKADDGTKFHPLYIDSDFRVEALRVKVSGDVKPGTSSVPGAKLLEIREIKRI